MKNGFLKIIVFILSALMINFSFISCNTDDDENETIIPETWEAKSGIFTLSADIEDGGVAVNDAKDAESSWLASFSSNNNEVLDPGIIADITGGTLNPIPSNDVTSNLANYPATWFENVSYKGAFGTENWAKNWTLLGTEFMSGSNNTILASESDTITDNGNGTGTVTWVKSKTYILNGLVFVNNGQILTIEAGTVIKGMPGQGENASALIIARGGKIIAEGNESEPIIFTSIDDDLKGSVSTFARGSWGGIIILGKAQLNSSPGETAIEGIPTDEPRGIYGGNDNNDDSGILKYVSIRHGGTDIGEGNEINGLTLGGVGNQTVIEFIEVISNKDDGIEFFGGTPQIKHIVVAFCADDSFDYDEGFCGKGQFWFAIQDHDEGDRIGEHDGGTDPENGTPYATPEIYNATYIGRGADAGKRIITFRDNAGGTYANSIFLSQTKGIDIELLASGECSYKRFQVQQLIVKNNIFYNVAENIIAE
ncbi:MAG: hypothetical protein KAT68_12830 [Bacteroidales bacterium]|nr:hypothetical protein [Bacteroidales bacterium]